MYTKEEDLNLSQKLIQKPAKDLRWSILENS